MATQTDLTTAPIDALHYTTDAVQLVEAAVHNTLRNMIAEVETSNQRVAVMLGPRVYLRTPSTTTQ